MRRFLTGQQTNDCLFLEHPHQSPISRLRNILEERAQRLQELEEGFGAVRCCLLARHDHGIPKLTTVGQQQHSTGRKKNVRGKVVVFGVPGGVGEQGGHNQDTTHIKLSKAFD